MNVKAIRVIRSATLDGHIHMPGEEGIVIRQVVDSLQRELFTVRWLKDGDTCVVLGRDISYELPAGSLVESGVCATIATPPRADQPKAGEVASSSPAQIPAPESQMADRVEKPGSLHPVPYSEPASLDLKTVIML